MSEVRSEVKSGVKLGQVAEIKGKELIYYLTKSYKEGYPVIIMSSVDHVPSPDGSTKVIYWFSVSSADKKREWEFTDFNQAQLFIKSFLKPLEHALRQTAIEIVIDIYRRDYGYPIIKRTIAHDKNGNPKVKLAFMTRTIVGWVKCRNISYHRFKDTNKQIDGRILVYDSPRFFGVVEKEFPEFQNR